MRVGRGSASTSASFYLCHRTVVCVKYLSESASLPIYTVYDSHCVVNESAIQPKVPIPLTTLPWHF